MTTRVAPPTATHVGLDWHAIRQQLIAAGVPVLKLLPASLPHAPPLRAVSAMWCAQRMWSLP